MNFLKSIILVLAFSQTATANCLGEAQIIAKAESAKVERYVEEMRVICRVKISESSVQFFAPNQLCPLDLAEVLNSGLVVAVNFSTECPIQAQDVFSGVLAVQRDGEIRLEKK